ncbi:MAG: TRAP transporter small permease [Synergistales bacterium]|nr:TRAP transporter small permease [Synergistales bacterium]
MLSALILCFVQVIARYVLMTSIPWSEEIAKWFVMWITFAGSAYAFKMGAHIGVEAFVNILPPVFKKTTLWIARLLTFAFLFIIGWQGILFLLQVIDSGQVAPASRLPMTIPYSALPFGFLLVIARLLDLTFREMICGETLESDSQ